MLKRTLALTCILCILTASSIIKEKACCETLAMWHLDEIYTPEAMDSGNNAFLGGIPPPELVEGKFGKALSFNGENFLYVPFSQGLYATARVTLYTPEEVTLEAWIFLNGFKNVEYNNVIVIAFRAGLEWQTITRICGIAVTPSDDPNRGFLRGYVYTDKDHFNEIITVDPIIPLNVWVHVAFTRSLSTGMHLYVNGEEVNVRVVSGIRNPRGNIIRGTEIFLGHDAKIVIDEPRICDVALNPSQLLIENTLELAVSRTEIDIGPNLMWAIVMASVAFAIAWLLRRIIQTWGISSRFKE